MHAQRMLRIVRPLCQTARPEQSLYACAELYSPCMVVIGKVSSHSHLLGGHKTIFAVAKLL